MYIMKQDSYFLLGFNLVVHILSFISRAVSDAAGEVAADFCSEHLPADIQEEKSKKEHLFLVSYLESLKLSGSVSGSAS